jgi:sulfur-oxidizing protein SoxY
VKLHRRRSLQAASGAGLYAALVAAGLLNPSRVSARTFDAAAFEAGTMADALRALGAAGPARSADVLITVPELAENGAVVPVTIRSNLPGTRRIALLVEKNPNPLAGVYELLGPVEPEVSMRVKMGQSSDVTACVLADGKWYMARKEVNVTLGGCGG